MVDISKDRLAAILTAGAGRRIMVIGDLMIDRYLWGNVSRISPEAPVPIIEIEDDEIRFGGSANVANNLVELGAEPVLVGVVGNDTWGNIFRERLAERHLTTEGLTVDDSRPTTIKTRIIGNNQHIARVDREKVHPIAAASMERIYDYIAGSISGIDAIIFQDYNKGVLIPKLIERVVALARQHNIITTVDPKLENFLSFRGVTLFKPNRKETEAALVTRLASDADVERAGRELLERLDAQAALITLSERGMALIQRDGQITFDQTRARKVADVSGAGDTVIATITFALAAGASMKESVGLANIAAGVVCGEVGVVPITRAGLQEALPHA